MLTIFFFSRCFIKQKYHWRTVINLILITFSDDYVRAKRVSHCLHFWPQGCWGWNPFDLEFWIYAWTRQGHTNSVPLIIKTFLTFNHQLQSLRSLILSFAVTMMNATKLIFATSLHVSVQNKRYKNNTNNNWALLLIEWIIWEFKTRFYKVLFMCTRSLQMFIKVVYKYSDPKAPFKREITDLLCP